MTISSWHRRFMWPCSRLLIVLACVLSLVEPTAMAQYVDSEDEEVVEKKEKKVDPDKTKIVINYDDELAAEEQYRSQFGQLFNNPALASGLSSGSAFVNRSIESVMEVVFYRLLDQELIYNINDHSQFKFGINRELFQVGAGSFVVVDRFAIGPQYLKELTRFQNIPVNFGVDGRVNVFDIYFTTDAMRLAKHQDLPTYQKIFNNWFGLLPLLSAILPPSFNPNEMYDPGNLLAVPFSFPVTIGGLRAMPVGAIRSYNISGEVRLPVQFTERLPKKLLEDLERADGLVTGLPYTVFAEGEYRINVLRRSRHIAWVGLTKVKRAGHRFSASLGREFELFDKLMTASWWAGLPARIFPLDATWAKSKLNVFNQLYEFDIRRPEARKAYKKAVKGDFTEAMKWHNARVEKDLDTGVRFHFTQKDDGWERASQTRPNLLILNSRREDVTRESEIEITDEQGKFYVLRSNQQVNDEFIEALTGRQREVINSQVEMEVERVFDPREPSKFFYRFDPNSDTPIEVTFSMQLQDRYINAQEYRKYVERIRDFTSLPLRSAPKIKRREEKRFNQRLRHMALANPTQDQFYLKVTPTYLGRFDATAAVRFPHDLLDEILATPKDEIWAALADSYGLSKDDWGTKQSRSLIRRNLAWGEYAALAPFEIVNIRSAATDFIAEATSVVDNMAKIRKAKKPMEKLRSYFDLFQMAHPEKLSKAFMLLTDRKRVPRSVAFNTNAKGKASKDVKKSFNELNGKVFRSVVELEPPDRSRLPDSKLREFFPDEVRERRFRPMIGKIDMSMRKLPQEYIDQVQLDRFAQNKPEANELASSHVYMQLFVKNMNQEKKGKFYIRIEEAGQLDLGKFTLGEQVISIEPKEVEEEGSKFKMFEFFLTGPLSPFQGRFFRNAVETGGEFRLHVAASREGRVWSDERNLHFVLDEGNLFPPK